jgi:hypothetical protein
MRTNKFIQGLFNGWDDDVQVERPNKPLPSTTARLLRSWENYDERPFKYVGPDIDVGEDTVIIKCIGCLGKGCWLCDNQGFDEVQREEWDRIGEDVKQIRKEIEEVFGT